MPWKPGQSGNPGGRAKDPVRQRIRELSGAHAEEALNIILGIARDETAPLPVRLNASNAILDRAVGRPATGIHFESDDVTETLLSLIAGNVASNPLNRVKPKAKPACPP
jgi:hypothetical protein